MKHGKSKNSRASGKNNNHKANIIYSLRDTEQIRGEFFLSLFCEQYEYVILSVFHYTNCLKCIVLRAASTLKVVNILNEMNTEMYTEQDNRLKIIF